MRRSTNQARYRYLHLEALVHPEGPKVDTVLRSEYDLLLIAHQLASPAIQSVISNPNKQPIVSTLASRQQAQEVNLACSDF